MRYFGFLIILLLIFVVAGDSKVEQKPKASPLTTKETTKEPTKDSSKDPIKEKSNSFNSLIGKPAEEWQVKDWLNSQALQLKDLSGKVVLVRWWTAGCPYCTATAPSLNQFYETYHQRGLQVIGFYHHKSSKPLNLSDVQQASNKFGFKFPVAIDYNWQTLNSWWLNKTDTRWTSVSFLIDRKGLIRHIHPGGQYQQGDNDYAKMQAEIERLLAEK